MAAARQLWEGAKAIAGKAGEGLKPLADKAGGRRLLWGAATAVLIILLVWAGAKMLKRPYTPAALQPEAETQALKPPPAAVAEAPRAPAPPAPPAPAAVSPKPPAAAEPAPPVREERYVVLVASYAKLDQAQALAKRLKTRNFAARVVKYLARRHHHVPGAPGTGEQKTGRRVGQAPENRGGPGPQGP